MPPFVPRKRSASPAPAAKQPPKKRPTPSRVSNKKTTLFETADAKPTKSRSVEENKEFLAKLKDAHESSLSDGNSDDFEDVLPKQKGSIKHEGSEHEHEDEEMDWEDAITQADSTTLTAPPGYEPSGDLELTLNALPNIRGSLTSNTKKGPSKIERQIRTSTHCMHVQFLMYHNLVRNGWICDKEVQKTLVGGLSPGCKQEYERWIKACGDVGVEVGQKSELVLGKKKNDKSKGKKGPKAHKNQRDRGKTAGQLEEGSANLSQGDPILRLLKTLSAYWRKRFNPTAPGLRKQGYKDLLRLEEETKLFRSNNLEPDIHGEQVCGIEHFRELAKACEGSRDVGAHLFTALIRALGLEARMVASLQPIGFGWNKAEDASVPKNKNGTNSSAPLEDQSDKIEDDSDVSEKITAAERKMRPVPPPSKVKVKKKVMKPRGKGGKDAPIHLSGDEGELSDLDAPSSDNNDDDDESVVDVTPARPNRSSKKYDYDLPAPIYWTEVLSPISNVWIPVDPMVLNVISGSLDNHLVFEPRGAKADKAKQVMAYVVGFSADGTAKDVTVRYLKRRMWPGRTKGTRMPVEKVPVYNKRGKILRTEEYDWFKDVMRSYARDSKKRTKADEIEDGKDLVAVRVVKEAAKTGEETLQGYKTSAEFVLERHLRREEALLPGVQSVKEFTTGKGDKAKSEPVYLRKDIAVCRTVESWHKEGREVKDGMKPLKFVPMRAVTLMRKREIEEAERESGEKLKQGLYSREQTDWIIPPPIKDGVIPKNAFGNMDVYVPTMVPKGAVHVRLKGTAKICRRLNIDYAEAVTGFEFGNKRAVPVITGVVVAKEHKTLLIDAWRADEVEKRKREEAKREKIVLGMWRKMLAGLRIVERVRREYGEDADAHIADAVNPMAAKKKKGKEGAALTTAKMAGRKGGTSKEPVVIPDHDDDDEEEGGGGFLTAGGDSNGGYGGGGFLPDGYEEEEYRAAVKKEEDDEAEAEDDKMAGGFILDDQHSLKKPRKSVVAAETLSRKTPVSLQTLHDNDYDLHGGDDEDYDGDDVDENPPPPPPPPSRTKTTKPKSARKAPVVSRGGKAKATANARKGKASVKSKYFVDSQDEEGKDGLDVDSDE